MLRRARCLASLLLSGLAGTAALALAAATLPASEPLTVEKAWRDMFRRDAEPPAPPDNPLTPARVALGERLFADPRLSGSGKRSCASCHRPQRSFTDGRSRALGAGGKALERNTPALWNLAWSKFYFWDGRAASLEQQVAMPVEAADELGGDWPAVVARLGSDESLRAAFAAAFPEDPRISRDTIVKALASYVRSLVSPPTRFDAWIGGDAGALRPQEVRGFRLFTGKAGCVLCHAGWRFTDDRFHDIGLRSGDGGRGAVAGGTPGLRAFKTPGLRELTRTAPYMHDGSLPALAAVVRHYAGGFVRRPSLAPHIDRNLRLTQKEQADLIAFLRALSSERPAPPKEAGQR